MSPSNVRVLCPPRVSTASWPEWSVFCCDLGGVSEIVNTSKRIIYIDPDGDEEWAIAHVFAHIDLGHLSGPGGDFTEQQESDADGLARLRLATDASDIM